MPIITWMHIPSSPTPSLITRLLAAILATAGMTTSLVAAPAAPAKTEMAPFKVEAEFGVDGLRIQNSTAVLNQHLLDQHRVTSLQDVAGIAPNLSSVNSDSRGFGDILTLRGMANTIFFSPPAVGLYVDDVPGGTVSSYASSLLSVESLVVKSGPQGTDYGRNAPAGVIEIKSRAPGANHRGLIQIESGSDSAQGAQAAFDGPVNDKIGYTAAIGYSEREGYIYNSFLKRAADDRSAIAGRGALHWRATDTLQLRVGFMAEKAEDDATRLTSLFSPDRFQVASNLNGETVVDRRQLSFHARQTFPWGTATAITSWQRFELDPATTDLDLSPLSLASSRVLQSEGLYTQEFRFESTPAANQLQWRGGLFLADSDVDGNALREFVVPPSQFVPPGFTQSERTVFEIGQRTLAAYGNVEQPITSATKLQVGVRAEHAESKLARTKAASNNFGFPSPQDPRLSLAQEHVYVSGSVGVVHALSKSLSLMGRTSIAQKPEGYSAFTGNPQLARFDNERSWANEVGLTFGPANARFGGSVLGFWNVIDGYQFERTVPNSTDFVVVNANEVRSRGLEGKFMFSPAENIWWDFQAGYTDATFTHHRDASGATMNGKRVPYIPELTLRTGVTVDLGAGLSANASYGMIGRSFYDERNTGMFSQPTYGIINAQLRYRFENWTASVYGQNLTDKKSYQFINPEIYAGSPGAPRRFGVQVSFSY